MTTNQRFEKGMMRNSLSPRVLFFAMGLSASLGYLVLAFAVRVLPPETYIAFAAFWSLLYLLLGAISGVQQEVTRSSTQDRADVRGEPTGARLWRTLIIWSIVTGVVIASIAFFLADNHVETVPALVLGASTYVILAGATGALYGGKAWRLLALLVLLDSLTRFCLIAWALGFSPTGSSLIWATVFPLPFSLAICLPWIFRRYKVSYRLADNFRQLSWNASRTIAGALFMAIVVTGFPYLISKTSAGDDPETVRQGMFIATMLRAPFAVVVVSLQSYLLVMFRTSSINHYRLNQKSVIGATLGILVCLTLGLLFGGQVFQIWMGNALNFNGGLFTSVLLAGGVALSAFMVISIALLAKGFHNSYLMSWVIAATSTYLILNGAGPIELRVEVAACVAPLVAGGYALTRLYIARFR